MPLEPREAVKRMRAYSPPTGQRHGKLRLDFNENTVGCSPRVAATLKTALTRELLATYPDYTEVKRQFAKFLEIELAQLLLTNGTDEAIHLLISTYVNEGEEVVVFAPSYAMYRFYAELAGAHVKEVPIHLPNPTARGNAQHETENALLSAITPETKAILLANPNNPTGTVICENDILAILEAAPNACVLIDEAYFEFYGKTVLNLLSVENLFVSRTFSKAYGLAGMRIGCLISIAENIATMHKCQSPYSVNMAAALAACEGIKDRKYVANYVRQTLQGRQLIEDAFKQRNIPYWPSHANFVLFDAGNKADECLARCREHGVLIRDRRHEIPNALRVTAGPPDQMSRFISLVEEIW